MLNVIMNIVGDNMKDEDKTIEDVLTKIDNIELVPEEELKNMDFYELAYYMQTLNMIDSIDDEESEGE